jgi:hypothetical protein
MKALAIVGPGAGAAVLPDLPTNKAAQELGGALVGVSARVEVVSSTGAAAAGTSDSTVISFALSSTASATTVAGTSADFVPFSCDTGARFCVGLRDLIGRTGRSGTIGKIAPFVTVLLGVCAGDWTVAVADEEGVVGLVESSSEGATDTEGESACISALDCTGISLVVEIPARIGSSSFPTSVTASASTAAGFDCCREGSSTCSEESSARFRRLRELRTGNDDSGTENQGS